MVVKYGNHWNRPSGQTIQLLSAIGDAVEYVYLYEDCSIINKLQNGVILLVFQT